VDAVHPDGKQRRQNRQKGKSRSGHADRTGHENVRSPEKERTYLDMPCEAGAGAGAGSLAQPPRPMAIAAIAMRTMYFMCLISPPFLAGCWRRESNPPL
jgi:hypothetical protein